MDLIDEIKTTTGNQDIEYHAWESRADEAELPKRTLVGVDQWSFEERRGLWMIRYAITVSSYKDANLLDEVDILDIAHKRTGEGNKVDLLDPDTGDLQSQLVVSAWQLGPMGSSELRNYRPIMIELLRTANN